ncbi:hypothetical protein [Desulfitobacterium sp.]|uniref:hypothetical protein n=1 Tax=Desulfitobacterium sp. TaxID=49981 RepID=UPI002B6DA0B6|nr:hypothetical protein [Desulfitobacterium sp.]HVJ49513.1 hypothetical protein [Desulfitobacterium sp.]
MKELSPIDLCGCGDTGYLSKRTIPIDLAQGLGHIHQVPIYHCGSKLCDQYTLPSLVVSRIDDLADIMEEKGLQSLEFYWEDQEGPQDFSSLVESLIGRLSNHKYEDVIVIFVLPGQSIVFQSQQDSSEFYQLKYLQKDDKGTWFSFLKFYSEEPLTVEEFPEYEPTYVKELGVIAIDEVEDALNDEFGGVI